MVPLPRRPAPSKAEEVQGCAFLYLPGYAGEGDRAPSSGAWWRGFLLPQRERGGRSMTYPRDLIGYGAHPPDPQWPNDARIAVQFVAQLRRRRRE